MVVDCNSIELAKANFFEFMRHVLWIYLEFMISSFVYLCTFFFLTYKKTHLLLLHMKRYIICVSGRCNAWKSKKHEKEE
jgi:hypothetical protein